MQKIVPNLWFDTEAEEAAKFYVSLFDNSEILAFKDKYGLSWQIVPARWVELATGTDPKKVDAAMRAMLGMKKLDIAELERAYDEA